MHKYIGHTTDHDIFNKTMFLCVFMCFSACVSLRVCSCVSLRVYSCVCVYLLFVAPDMSQGTIADMVTLGVTESFQVKRQVLLSASEAAEMILRVDNIVKAAPRSVPPLHSTACSHWLAAGLTRRC